MKNILFSIILLGLAFSASAQRIDTRNHRAVNDYEMKLDSVIGSDDFDFRRWKTIYAYQDTLVEEISYRWENQAWVPETKTELGTASNNSKYYRWTEEGWEFFKAVTSEVADCGDESLLQSVTTTTLFDSVWRATARSIYEYDDLCRLVLNVNYTNSADSTDWQESARVEYFYNANGLLDTVYSTSYNGFWNDTQRRIYTYDDQNQCVSILAQRRGGGPFGNSWRDSYKYEFEYLDGNLQSELYYAGGGWFGGGDLTLDSKVEYAFDANGNMVAKTASVNNDGKDWIVRDVYENRFDLTVDASKVLGLERFWESIVEKGMGYASGSPMPLKNRWLSCTIASTNLDTDFTLYCSGFEAVGEQQQGSLKAYAEQGRLLVESPSPITVFVYDLTGRLVVSQSMTTSCSFNLKPGLYLVKGGNQVAKVIVR